MLDRLIWNYLVWVFGMVASIIIGFTIALILLNIWGGLVFTIPTFLFCCYKWVKNLIKIIEPKNGEKKP